MKNTLLIAAMCLLSALTSPHLRAADAPKPPPNVLFIAIDDMRDWVGYLGKNPQTITPNLDKLAARGVYFAHSYCAAPVCNASRAALMTGLRPNTTGVYENNNDWRTVIPQDLPLTTQFRKAGYYVCGSGKIYHESYNRLSEWDDYLRMEGKDPEPQGDTGVGGIKFAPLQCNDDDLREGKIVGYAIKQLQTKHDKPLFLACGLHKPHMPWNVPQKYYDMHPLDKIEIPPHLDNDLDDVPPAGVKMATRSGDHARILKANRWKDAVQGYLAAITYSDAMIGKLMDVFDKSDYRDNTIIVLWSDHGWHLGEKEHWRKFALWEEATRQPFIIVAPGVTKPGGACDATVDLMCVYPTLCELCGLPIPAHVQGQSIRTLLENPKAPWDKPAVMTYKFMNHAVRTAEWRYIRYANGDEELYHDSVDQYEWTNLALKPEYAKEKAEMIKLLPQINHADIGGTGGQEDFGDKPKKKAKKAAAEAGEKPK